MGDGSASLSTTRLVDIRFCVLGWMSCAWVTAGELWPSAFATTCEDLVRGTVLCEREQVRPEQGRDLERAAGPLRLADLDPEETALVVEIAHHAIGHLRRPHPHQQRGEHADGGVVADVRVQRHV